MESAKKKLRLYMQMQRDALSDETVARYSEKITQHISDSTFYKTMKRICIYQAFRNEVSCSFLKDRAFADGKQVYVPVTDTQRGRITFWRIYPDTEWIKGAYGIYEPKVSGRTEELKANALICMPGLCFDKHRHRIGYGGGYYDKYLAVHREHTTVALCYQFQIVDTLPYEAHDILPDYIVTEQGIQ